MKKKVFLMALVGAALTACSNHDFETWSEGEIAQSKYEAAFIKRFGQPAPNHTWGFGDVTRSGMTRAITPTYSFPSDADASKFLTAVPEGVEKRGDFEKGAGYIDESYTGNVNIWVGGNGSAIYVSGTNDFSGKKFYVLNSDVYLVKGAKLTIESGNETAIQAGCNVYIAEGAELVLKTKGGTLTFACNIYNHGKITADAFVFDNNGLLYNKGDVKVDGRISVENSNTVLVNDGNISGANLKTDGTGKIQNNGAANISGETLVNSNFNTWVNNGQYTTGSFKYEAGSNEVINNCHLVVKGEFYIRLGNGNGCFRMDGGASVEAETFHASATYKIIMGSHSLFKVNGEAKMRAAADINSGIYGEGTDYAVFQAKDIVAEDTRQNNEIVYGGKLYVVANSHPTEEIDAWNKRLYFKDGFTYNNNIFTNGNVPAITIEATECNPGFNGKTPEDPDPTPSGDIRVIAEDLTVDERGDFDFNDVVFDIILKEPAGKTTIILRAAGGTLPLMVAGHEVHAEFGVATNVMVNTKSGVEKDPVTFTVDGELNANDVKVEVEKNGQWIPLTAVRGHVPGKIAVPVTYEWCSERQDIETKYPLFKNYVGSPELEWWKK